MRAFIRIGAKTARDLLVRHGSLEDALAGGRRRLTLDDREIDVNFPAGVRDGQLIRLPGKGAPGRDGGPAGDLYLRIALKPHPHFRRRGEHDEAQHR